MHTPLKIFLAHNFISQADLARGIEKTTAFVSQLVKGDVGASQDTIESILVFLTSRLGRPVTYEEIFGPPSVPAVPVVEAGS